MLLATICSAQFRSWRKPQDDQDCCTQQTPYSTQSEPRKLTALPIVTKAHIPFLDGRIVDMNRSSQDRRTLVSLCQNPLTFPVRIRTVVAVVCAGLSITFCQASSAQSIKYNLLELPTSERAIAALAMPAAFDMSQTPLRDGLSNLSRAYDISIWLDRRIDPTSPITLRVSTGQTLEQAINAIARLARAEAALVENVIYFGPKDQVASIQRAAVRLHDSISRSAFSNTGSANAEMRPLSWDELATPADIENEIGSQWSVQVSLDLPHDLFHRGQLKPCTLATQLTILCAGFARQSNLDASGTFRSASIETKSHWHRTYQERRWSQRRINELRKTHKGTTIASKRGVWNVHGSTDLHIELSKLDRIANRPEASRKTVVSGRLYGPAEALIKQYGESQLLNVEWDSRCSASQKAQYVDFEVENATTAQVLQAFAKAAKLNVLVEGSTIRVSPLQANPPGN